MEDLWMLALVGVLWLAAWGFALLCEGVRTR